MGDRFRYSIKVVFGLLTICFYFSSLYIPAVDSHDPMPGWLLLLYGLIGFVTISEIRWLANILIAFSLLFVFSKNKPPKFIIASAFLTVLLTVSFLFIAPRWVGGGGGSPTIIKTDLLLGGYLWIVSSFTVLIALLIPVDSKQEKSIKNLLSPDEFLCPKCKTVISKSVNKCPSCAVDLI